MKTNNILALGRASRNPEIRNRQQKEADEFNPLGMKLEELVVESQMTCNPILRKKILDLIVVWKECARRSRNQNELSLQKLEDFKVNALGIGLRRVLGEMRKYVRGNKSREAEIVLTLLELEYANIEAKRHNGETRRKIYERKCILLERLEPMLYECKWKYGFNYADGKNASYLIFVYLPNGVQLSWHCNEFEISQEYPYLEEKWDGLVCSTMEKIISYIGKNYINTQQAA